MAKLDIKQRTEANALIAGIVADPEWAATELVALQAVCAVAERFEVISCDVPAEAPWGREFLRLRGELRRALDTLQP